MKEEITTLKSIIEQIDKEKHEKVKHNDVHKTRPETLFSRNDNFVVEGPDGYFRHGKKAIVAEGGGRRSDVEAQYRNKEKGNFQQN